MNDQACLMFASYLIRSTRVESKPYVPPHKFPLRQITGIRERSKRTSFEFSEMMYHGSFKANSHCNPNLDLTMIIHPRAWIPTDPL